MKNNCKKINLRDKRKCQCSKMNEYLLKTSISNNDVNLFFACDDNYIPMFAVVLESIRQHVDKNRNYNIKILYTGNISQTNQDRIMAEFSKGNMNIEFVDITDKISAICEKLHTRDYYSKSTYYRLFIPVLYPHLDKALYLDSDIVLLGDVAELYDKDLRDNLVGAIPDESVGLVPEFQQYALNRINLDDYKKYFNAGILLMNLKKLREISFEDLFLDLISNITFNVAQDQDYLNTICKDRVLFIDKVWNKMPISDDVNVDDIKLIHYNLSYKPWHVDGVNYADKFWQYSDNSIYSEEVRKIKQNYSTEEQTLSNTQTVNLILEAAAQANDEVANKEIIEKVENIKKKYFK